MTTRILFILFLLLSCGCFRVTEAKLLKAKHDIEEVIDFIEMRRWNGKGIPADFFDLMTKYKNETGTPYPEKVKYAAFGGGNYKAYCYVSGRTSLWYLSFDDGYQNKGWWLDDESGRPLKQLWTSETP